MSDRDVGAAADEELTERAHRLQAAGLALLDSLDLHRLFADIGPLRVMGSVVSGLMAWRDLDVGVLVGPAFGPAEVVRVLGRLLDKPGVVGLDLRDERGDRTPAERRDERYHVTVHVDDEHGDRWYLDLSLFLFDLHDHVADWHLVLRDTVTADERAAVLRIKDVWHRRPEYPDEVSGWDVYQAVLHHGVRTAAQFGAWLTARERDGGG